MPYYTIHLDHLEVVRRPSIVREVIRAAFEPLVARAGLELNLVERPVGTEGGATPDVSMIYQLNRDVLNPRRQILAEQSGVVLVGSILDMRAAGEPRRTCTRQYDRGDPLRGSYLECAVEPGAPTRPLFREDEPELARTVGNVTVHELGHTIGNLVHSRDPVNHMFSGASINRVLGPGARTWANLRRIWAGLHRFSAAQEAALVDAIRARELRGVDAPGLR